MMRSEGIQKYLISGCLDDSMQMQNITMTKLIASADASKINMQFKTKIRFRLWMKNIKETQKQVFKIEDGPKK